MSWHSTFGSACNAEHLLRSVLLANEGRHRSAERIHASQSTYQTFVNARDTQQFTYRMRLTLC